MKAIMEINRKVRADMLTILCIMTGIYLYNMKNNINGVTTLFRLPRAEPEVNYCFQGNLNNVVTKKCVV